MSGYRSALYLTMNVSEKGRPPRVGAGILACRDCRQARISAPLSHCLRRPSTTLQDKDRYRRLVLGTLGSPPVGGSWSLGEVTFQPAVLTEYRRPQLQDPL